MRAIRAWHKSMAYYGKIFQDIANMSPKDYFVLKKKFGDTHGNAFDCTNRLTTLRKNLSNAGYAAEVEQADTRFLEEHRGFNSEKDWEDFWREYCNNHNLDLREDAL